MTNVRPNALSLAVAIAISSSIISTQAQAERKLQTKSLDISNSEFVSFTQSLVRVQPTLSGDQQPIPKSFTTTYPDQTQARDGYTVPSDGFTDILSAVSAGVSSVDLFETGENDIAQKYTKVLKVGDEEVFRFTHSLEETKLTIEVRGGMTDQDTVDAVRDQLTVIPSLEPLTKIARPEQLYAVLEGADDRAGNLGTSDHYVALATIKVEPVEVNGRTFMRLIASGDQPPELKRLGQSLFVNDETLLAAATSAYIQVHVLKEELQQEALDRLLALSKPIGYVVHEEDCTKVYPAPSGYPKLVPGHTQEDTIVFYSQKLNPADIAFVENLYSLLTETEPDGLTHATTKVQKYKVKSYLHVIRSKQWALLEELAARSDAGFSKDKLTSLAYYEALQQALVSATPQIADKFELTLEHLKVTSSVITPIWMHYQLVKYFGFCGATKSLLTDQRFIQNMEELIHVIRDIYKVQADAPGDEEFASRVLKAMSRQMLIDTYDKIDALQKIEGDYIRPIKHLELTAEKDRDSEREKLRAPELKQQTEHGLAKTRKALEEQQNPIQKQQQEAKRFPSRVQLVTDAMEKATKIRNAELAEELGIGKWDDTQTSEEQASRIRERIHKIFSAVAATGQLEEDTVRTNLAAIEGQLGIVPDNKNDLDTRFQSIQQHLQQQEKLTDKAAWNRLANIEGQHRKQHLRHLQKLEKQKNWLQELKQKVDRIPVLREELRDPVIETIENYNEQLADKLGIDNWVETEPTMAEQATIIRKEIHKISKSGQLPQEGLKEILASIESKYDITPNNENDLAARIESIQQQLQQELQQKTELIDDLICTRLANFEDQLGLPDNDYHLEYRQYALQQHLKQRIEQVGQEHLLQLSIKRKAEKIAATKARFATIAAHLNIEDFDRNADIDVQQERLLEKIKTMDAQKEMLFQRVETLSDQQDIENFYTRARKCALAAALDIDLSEDNTPEDRRTLESTVNLKLFRLAELKEEVKESRTRGHHKAKPEVLETLRAVEEALEMSDVDENDSVYLRREDISENMQEFITEARERAEEEALEILEALEQVFEIKSNEGDDNAARLARVRTRLDGDLSEVMQNKIHSIVWQEDSSLVNMKDLKPESLDTDITLSYPKKGGPEWLDILRRRLTYKVEEVDEQASEIQTNYLAAIENRLKIYPHENNAAEARSMVFTARLARDLQVEFANDANLPDRRDALRARISTLLDEVYQDYEDEAARRAWNNEIAHQLNIKAYKDDATIDDQVRQIDAKLRQLDDEAFSAGEPNVQERIAAIEDKLDRQMARLGPEPRYVLDLKVTRARQTMQEAESELEAANQELNAIRIKHLASAGTFAFLKHIPDEAVPDIIEKTVAVKPESADTSERWVKALRNKQLQLGGDDGAGGEIRQLIQKHAFLEAEIETRKADFEGMKDALKAAEKAVENDDGPFQYTPRQADVLEAIHKCMQQHPLKRQALQAAMGLAESAAQSGKIMPCLTTFNFDDEYAPIHLQALVGDKLTFKQTSRMVEVFKHLKTTFPESSHQPLEEVQTLVHRARNEMNKGAQQYNDEIDGIGSAGIHYVEHETGDLEGFSEYFASHSASGNKIIGLLREGLINKVELENYLKAIRGVDGYQTVDEFEHFLGYKQGVKVPEFRKVIQMLSDEGAEQFMGIAITPVTMTATGPTAMKESVDSMKEYAAAVIANYVLDDIAFENGRRMAAFLANVQETLTPYANAVSLSESELIQAIHDTLMQAHAAAVEQQLNDYWVKPSAFLVQAVTWYYSSYKPLLVNTNARRAAELSLSNVAFLYLLDLTNRGDYLHRMLTPFQHWLERYGVDPDRTGQYAYHSGIEQVSEVGGLAMPLGKAASSVILLRTGSMLFARQYNANLQRYRSISRLVPEIVKSMGSGQGVQVPLLNRVTPQKVKTLASTTAALVLGPVATVGAYAHGLISGFTYAQTFGFALASSLTFDFFMNDNKMLTQWLGGPLGRSLDKFNRWRGAGESDDEYVKRTAIATPQYFSETDEEYAYRVKANNTMYGWTRHENYLQFRERRDRTLKLFENSWEKYFRENVPKWSFSHAESIPYSYTLGALFESTTVKAAPVGLEVKKFDLDKNKNTRDEL
ncbi:hypothetical protein [Endozoicomonas sp. 2B-B]